MKLMKPKRDVGIIGYGAYVPRYRIRAEEIARVWGGAEDGLPIEEKAVPGFDEDTVTMSIEAARNALARAGIEPQQLRALWVGSESHPYAVKPSSTIVAEAIGAAGSILAARLGIRVQSRHRSVASRDRSGRLGDGGVRDGDWDGHRARSSARRARIHCRGRRRGVHRRSRRRTRSRFLKDRTRT